jgi:hypothetical protein
MTERLSTVREVGLRRLAILTALLPAFLTACDTKPPQHELPYNDPRIGGIWVSEDIVDSNFTACVKPSTTESGIDYVNITGIVGNDWKILQTVYVPDGNGNYCTTEDLSNLDIEGDGKEHLKVLGPFTTSFDVHVKNGNYKKSPNGERTLPYSP